MKNRFHLFGKRSFNRFRILLVETSENLMNYSAVRVEQHSPAITRYLRFEWQLKRVEKDKFVENVYFPALLLLLNAEFWIQPSI